jgi:hypothetical protein
MRGRRRKLLFALLMNFKTVSKQNFTLAHPLLIFACYVEAAWLTLKGSYAKSHQHFADPE